ncbi:MAG: hypothetical protein GY941_07625 [Planctomycetes bacterium]|nr:hypothetical protein [Planctomycetota bacterium]
MKEIKKLFSVVMFIALISFLGTQVDAKETPQININKATVKELITLKGIGAKKAKDIIVYREKNGSYEQIEDIMEIKGIGNKMFEKIKDQITVRE